jgi:uncharacterized protein
MTQSVETIQKPAPEPDEASRPFFDGAMRGTLMIQRCERCGAYLAPGGSACTECLGEALAWEAASGKATLHTFGIMHQRYHPAFADAIPYNVAVVELEEGPRLQSNIVDCANDALRVGMALTVVFERLTDDVAIPKFHPIA